MKGGNATAERASRARACRGCGPMDASVWVSVLYVYQFVGEGKWNVWLSGEGIEPKIKGSGVRSCTTGHVYKPWASFESTLPLSTEQ